MSDSDMDKVTAGTPGNGLGHGFGRINDTTLPKELNQGLGPRVGPDTNGLGHAFGRDTTGDAKDLNQGLGPNCRDC